ncbi:uncharacterized protein FSUBG_13666 [Fusarium subglutinans]|uniref:Apple domain-containing protein n=1 Tax=Gibberella subglutinans TaxID=42677 RepID=A0A8H5NXE7_GIBSU|nr:uncharacterized protein FSUBG_13666 [Fusarium subglutinans]KAF5579175.1 hypothetical protein FSUBG_13666 [Fusarium subglutinans]
MRPQTTLCAIWASLIPLCSGINISPTAKGGLALAQILFGNSRDIYSSSSGYSGDPAAIRSFTDGPFGMGSGIIISTGSLTAAPLTPGSTCPSSYTTDQYDAYTQSYCGPDSYNGANYLLNVVLTKATTFVVDMVIASCDVVSADKVLILVNGVNVAKDETGTPLDSSSKYLSDPWGIPSPNGDTAFAWTSPPLRFSIKPSTPSIELKIAVCDLHNGYGDTAVMIKMRPCNDCDQPFKVDYDTTSVVSTTTYEATSVVTQAASGTVRGTISYVTYVTASATSTTSLSSEASTTLTDSATSSDSTPSATSTDSAISSSSEASTTITDSASSSDFTSSATSTDSAISSSSEASTTLTDSAISSESTSSLTTRSSAPVPCNQLSNPYDGPSNTQFEIVCNSYSTGGNQIGPSFDATDLEICIGRCGITTGCKVALFDKSQLLCYLMDESDGPTPNNLFDMALVLAPAPTTTTTDAISTTTEAVSATTSAASGPLSCDQLDSPTSVDGVEFNTNCGWRATGSIPIEYNSQVHSLSECMAFCADNLACRALNFNHIFYECYLYEDFSGIMQDSEQDMAYVASRPAVSSTTEAPTELSTTTSLATTSTAAAPGPSTCSQMEGSTYTGPHGNGFTVSCDTSSTGESIYRRDEEDSMKGCLDRCDNDNRCIAVNFQPPPYSECDLIESFAGTQASPGTDFASKILSSTSTSTSSETSVSVESTAGSTISTLYTSSSVSISSESQETSSALTSETTTAGTTESSSFTTTSSVTFEATTSLFTSLSSSEDIASGTTSHSALQSTTLESTSASAASATTSIEATAESSSFTTTSSVTSEATTSLPATSSQFTSLSSSQDIASVTTSDSALQSTLESTSASATTSIEVISSTTELSASTSTDFSSPSSESVSESTTVAQSVSTSAEESTSLELTTVATSTGSLHTDTSSVDMSPADTSTTKASTVQTPSTTTSVTAIDTAATASSVSYTSHVSTEIQSTSDTSALPSTSSTPSAINIPTIGEYTFTGCLKSLEGYPSFKEVATDPGMTTRKCIDLALGSAYIGVYQEADVLDDTEFVADARCDLTCPGDRTLFCGGILRAGRKLLHREIAPNHLLTLYRKKLPSTSDVSSSSSSVPTSSSSRAYESTSESSGPAHSSQTDASYSFSSFTTKNTGSKTLSVSDSTVTETNSTTCLSTSLPTPTAIHTAYSTLTIDHAYTKTRFAETVTTVTYTTVNPSNPASLITTCVPITLLYSPCGCKNQVYPTVDMTTVACTQGGDIVTLTVPKAVCETGPASHTHPIVQYPSGWVGGHQTDAGGNSYPTGGSQPGSKNGQPEYPTETAGIQGSHPSYKTHQHVAPTSAGATNGYKQPEQGNPQPSVPVQGSADSNSNSPANPSQPSSPKSLTTGTSIIPTSPLGNSARPSQSSSVDQGQAPSESKGAPYTTSVVVSEAHRYDLTSWIMITALVGMLLFFYVISNQRFPYLEKLFVRTMGWFFAAGRPATSSNAFKAKPDTLVNRFQYPKTPKSIFWNAM